MKSRKALAFIIFLGLSASARPQVLHGQPADPDSMNYLVHVRVRFDIYNNQGNNNLEKYGGGIIVHESFVLTAATHFTPTNANGQFGPHVLRPVRVIVTAGTKDMNLDIGQVRECGMDRVHPHPKFHDNETNNILNNEFDAGYDVALIHLPEKLHLGQQFRTSKAVLPPFFWFGGDLQLVSGTDCRVTGWGSTQAAYPNHAMEGQVKVKRSQDCRNHGFAFFARNHHLCYGCDQGAVPCVTTGNRDQGGPVACRVNGVEYVFAVHSYGRNTHWMQPDTMDVGVRINQEKRDWIHDTMRQNDFYGFINHRISEFKYIDILYFTIWLLFMAVLIYGVNSYIYRLEW